MLDLELPIPQLARQRAGADDQRLSAQAANDVVKLSRIRHRNLRGVVAAGLPMPVRSEHIARTRCVENSKWTTHLELMLPHSVRPGDAAIITRLTRDGYEQL